MPLEQEATMQDIFAEEAAEAAAEVAATPEEIGAAGDDVEVVIADDPAGETAAPAEPAAAEAAAPGEQASEAGPDPLDAELEETDKAYPEPIKKRIKREIRIRKRVEGELVQLQEVAVKVAGLAKVKEDENQRLNAELAVLRKQHADVLDMAFENRIAVQMEAVRKARDDNDYDAEEKARAELSNLQIKHNQIREVRDSLARAPQTQPQAQPQPQAQTPAQPQEPAPQRRPAAPGAVKWLDTNKAWFTNPKFAGQAAFVLAVDKQLVREGFSPMSEDYYTELDSRIDAAFPTLRKTGAAPGSPVAAVRSPGATSAVRQVGGKKTFTLTKADLENMRRYGLDPSNKAHLVEYARNKEAA